jgi:hypothetical protein
MQGEEQSRSRRGEKERKQKKEDGTRAGWEGRNRSRRKEQERLKVIGAA